MQRTLNVQEDTNMAKSTWKKKSFTLLVIRETQTKTTRQYFTSTRMAIIKKHRKEEALAKMWQNWKTCAMMVGMQNGRATVENSVVVPQKVQHRMTMWSSNSTPSYLSKRFENRDTNVQISIIHKSQKVGKDPTVH